MTTTFHTLRTSFGAADASPKMVVKTCGIMHVEHAVVAAAFGADLLGLIFAPSRRAVSVAVAASIRAGLEGLDRRPLLVGVFVNEHPGKVLAIAGAAGLDIVQLSGDETPVQVAECAAVYPVLKTLRFSEDTLLGEALYEVQRFREAMPADRLRFLIDAFSSGAYGGTGRLSNWSLAAQLAEHEHIVLAGGLDPYNVARAVRRVSPWGVDVSSGIEEAGVKDPGLIRAFIERAKSLAD